MSKYEKLGNYLLFEKTGEDKVSRNFLAGQIIKHKIQKIHEIKKYDQSFSSSPDFVTGLIQSQELLKQLSNPTLHIPIEVVHEKSQLGSVFDYVEGQTLNVVLKKCAQDGYPFSGDHALLIGSRICVALEFLHTKKVDNRRLVHGYVSPENVYVTYDGEVKLLYLDLAHHLLKVPAGRDRLLQAYRNHVSPELANQNQLDRSSDIYSAGVLIFQLLSGESYNGEGREASPTRVELITMSNQAGDRLPVPDEVKEILVKALSSDPAQRYNSITDMRKAIDQFLFAGEFAPTTFNLAFFMNTLFREVVDKEARKREEWKKLDVAAFTKEERPAPVKPPVGAEKAKDIPVGAVGAQPTAVSGPQEIFGIEEPKEKSKAPLFIGILVIIAAIATIGFIFLKPSSDESTQASAPQLTPQQIAERRQLEMEAQKAQEIARAKDQELQDLQTKMDEILKAQAKSASAPDPAVQKMQQKLAQLEQEKRQQEALAEAKLKAAQAPAQTFATPPQSAESPPPPSTTEKSAEEAAPPATESTPPEADSKTPEQPATTPPVQQRTAPTPAPQPPPASQTVKEGDLVELTPDVTKPKLVKRINPTYPGAALARKAEGTVILSLLVSEKGDVTDAKILRGVSGPGLDQAALDAVRKWKFTPAMKDGKRVRVWVTYPIVFKMQ